MRLKVLIHLIFIGIFLSISSLGAESFQTFKKVKQNTIFLSKKNILPENKITGLYVAYFNRAPDIDGILYWLNEVDKSISNGGNPSDVFRKISKGFSEHDIFISTYSHLNNKNFINAIYQNMSGKDGDAEGIAYWKGELDRGVSRSDMVASFVEALLTDDFNEDRFSYLSPEEKTKAQARQDYLTNKVFVSIHFLNNLWSLTNITTYPIENDPSYLASKNILVGITEDASTVTTATDFLDSIKDDIDPIGRINSNMVKKLKGKFIDSPVEGLSYRVGNFHGTTTKDGYFEYTEAGENIFFYIGNLNIGVAKAGKNIHINDLEGDFISDRNTKIAQLLLSLDTDGDPTNNIQLPQNIASRFDDSSDFSFDIPQDEFDTQLKNKLKEWNIDNFVDSDKADEHIKKSGIELAKLCPLPNPKNTYENKEITDLSCIDKARLDYFYKRVAPLFHSSMNAEYAQTVIIDESYNDKAVKKLHETDKLLNYMTMLDGFIGTMEASEKGKIFEQYSEMAKTLSSYVQIFINEIFLFKENSKNTEEAIIRANKRVKMTAYIFEGIVSGKSCLKVIHTGKDDGGACKKSISALLNAGKTYLSLDDDLKSIDKNELESYINTLIYSLEALSHTVKLAKAKDGKEALRAVFGMSESMLSLTSNAILSTYRKANDGRDPTPAWESTYIWTQVLDEVATPVLGIAKECYGATYSAEPMQVIKCGSKIVQEARKKAVRLAVATVGQVQMISTVKNMNEQIVASRVLEELLFAGSANHKKVYDKYGIKYGGGDYLSYVRFGALIEAIGKKELGFNGIQGYEPWFSSAWTALVDRHPFSVEDVRSLVSSAYKRIVRETSIDFESPAIDISVINYNQVGARDIRMDIESSKHYGVKNTKLVCYSDYDSNRSLLSPWSGSFNDKFSFFEDTNTHFFKIGFETSGYRNLSCNLYNSITGAYLGSKSVSLGVLAPKNLDMGSDKTIYEGQSMTLDVPKIIDSDIKIVKYRYSHINPYKAYGENSSSKPFTISNLKLNSDGTSRTHEILVTVITNNGIIEKKIIKVTVLPKDEDIMVAPKNLTATSTTDSITLNWDEVPNASIYKICMSTSSISDGSKCEENGGTLISGGTSTTKTITDNLNMNTTYYFRVRGFNSEYNGGLWSDEKSIKLEGKDIPKDAKEVNLCANQTAFLNKDYTLDMQLNTQSTTGSVFFKAEDFTGAVFCGEFASATSSTDVLNILKNAFSDATNVVLKNKSDGSVKAEYEMIGENVQAFGLLKNILEEAGVNDFTNYLDYSSHKKIKDVYIDLYIKYVNSSTVYVILAVTDKADDNSDELNDLVTGDVIDDTKTVKQSKTDTFTYSANTLKTDILFVMDDSGSMKEEQNSASEAIVKTFGTAMSSKGIDWKATVIGTEDGWDYSSHIQNFVKNDISALAEQLKSIGLDGGDEVGLKTAYTYLKNGDITIRNNSKLSIVYISDEIDHTNLYELDVTDINDSYFVKNKIKVNVIIPLTGDYEYSSGARERDLAYKMANATGGEVANLRNYETGYDAMMQKIADDSAGSASQIILSEKPTVATIVVKVNGKNIDSSKWNYNSSNQSIVFIASATPKVGDKIEVIYNY